MPQHGTANGRVNHLGFSGQLTVFMLDGFGNTYFNASVQLSSLSTVRLLSLSRTSQVHTFAFRIDLFTGHVVQTQYHVLRRYDDWIT
ncbi:Uncharacterised protein [Vibrio cholerae]|uniref:Uncharacterized protein n=1 Tax=Vibrio cholerae TaxID=666 RepID=A0A655TUR4_VIBCL|nr:Uncharacterised protein [Vibrio cholerae]CSB40077.1 Uncharacterised protein [Vibrio cholerae]CSD47545.1 Uncharacterised protein [Vibrio cholerae]CSD69353.1 Uncharacterised protein [Vibrio cholerae]CSD71214.1 Uncharacterised protein [Vibrio cholerae]